MENNDVNNGQAVTDPQDANTEQVVTAPDVNTDVVNQQVADNAAQNQEAVPYDRFKEVNEAKKVAEEARLHAERQLELYQQAAQQQVQPVQQQAPKSVAQMALDSLGLTADDLYGENLIRYHETKDQINAAQLQQSNARMADQQFIRAHPDVTQVVGSVNPATGQLMTASPELNQILMTKPYLASACTTVEAAYNIVLEQRQLAELNKTAAVSKEHLIRNNVQAATQPLGGSAAGGGGSGEQSGQGLLNRDQVAQIQADIDAGKYS
jgi:hypothetical protein